VNTGIAQLVALAAHGNAAILRMGSPDELDHSPLFHHVADLSFAAAPGNATVAHRQVSRWFDGFRQRGIVRTRFVRLSSQDNSVTGPDRSAFANGEQSALAAIHGDDAMELWAPDWQSVKGQPGWTLTYRGISAGKWEDRWNGAPVDTAATRLDAALSEIATFAGGQGLESWVGTFNSAREALHAAEPPSAMGLLPSVGYSAAARVLLGGALSSWVFGGMGSWNDTGPRDSDQYARHEELTAALYDALMDGLVSAANAFDPTIR
jgi:hypothetical protein